MATLFNAMHELARQVGNAQEGYTSAGGTSTTLIDTAARTERNDYWNGGTLFISSGTYAGSSRLITDFDQATATVTFTPALGGAPGAGVTYTIVTREWPQLRLNHFINRAYRKLNQVPTADETTLSVAAQESYTLPAGVANVIRVEVASNLAAPYEYVPYHGVWEERAGKIYFKTGRQVYKDGYKIRFIYMASPTALTADDSVINTFVNVDRLIAEAAVEAWRWRIQVSKEDEPMYTQFLAQALLEAERMEKRYPIPQPVRTPIYSVS